MSAHAAGSRPLAPLGVLLAGGLSRRYGEPKAFARVAGTRIVDRVLAALRAVSDEIGVVANDSATYATLGLPIRADERPGEGVLGGIHTAIGWASERGRNGALVVACDMPFLHAGLLRDIVDHVVEEETDLVVPESRGPRGVEPLCAWYGPACRAAIEAQLLREDRRVIGFWRDVRTRRVPLERVLRHGDPERLFMNVNTREDRLVAEELAGAPPSDSATARPWPRSEAS